MPEQVLRRRKAFALAFLDRASELIRVPVDDDCRKEIEPGDTEVLGLACPIAYFSLTTDPQGTLEGMVCLALVQADIGSSLHVDIQQPVDDEQRPFDPSDLPESDGQVVLPRKCCELPQELAWRHHPRGHRGHAAQDIGPVGDDRVFPYPVTDQPFQISWDTLRTEYMKSLGRKVTNAGNEEIAEKGGDGEDEVGEAARVGILFPDPPTGLVHEKAVQGYTAPRSPWPG